MALGRREKVGSSYTGSAMTEKPAHAGRSQSVFFGAACPQISVRVKMNVVPWSLGGPYKDTLAGPVHAGD